MESVEPDVVVALTGDAAINEGRGVEDKNSMDNDEDRTLPSVDPFQAEGGAAREVASEKDTGGLFNSTAIPLSGRDPVEFGEYLLVEEIARGGMGVVYRAEQPRLRRSVALKMIQSSLLTSESDVQRFLVEAEAAAALEHPNIVPIYDVGKVGNQHYFTMRLVPGGTLGEKMKEWQPDPRSCARFIVKVAKAVHSAHSRGIIHRDLKPGNILIDESGEPQITDFGIAKFTEKDTGLTLTG